MCVVLSLGPARRGCVQYAYTVCGTVVAIVTYHVIHYIKSLVQNQTSTVSIRKSHVSTSMCVRIYLYPEILIQSSCYGEILWIFVGRGLVVTTCP